MEKRRSFKQSWKERCQFEKWWNIEDKDSGHQKSSDTARFTQIRKIDDDPSQQQVLAINVPRWRHCEPACREAKRIKLEKLDKFEVYEEVKDKGQKYITTN